VSELIEIQFNLIVGQRHVEQKINFTSGKISFIFNKEKKNIFLFLGKTCSAAVTLPKEFSIGYGKLTINGTAGLNFKEKRSIIVYDNGHVLLVQTSASTYRPQDTMKIRVLATNENLVPIQNGELTIEIYVRLFFIVSSLV